MTELRLKLHQPLAFGYLSAAALATVRWLADENKSVVTTWWAQEKPVSISGSNGELGKHTVFELPAGGYYAIDIMRPRGADIVKQVFVPAGETLTETITMPEAPHEYLGWQQYAGVVRADLHTRETDAFPASSIDSGGASSLARLTGRPFVESMYHQAGIIARDHSDRLAQLFAVRVPDSAAAWSPPPVWPSQWHTWFRILGIERQRIDWPRKQDPEFDAWFPPMPDAQQGLALLQRLRTGEETSADLERRFPRWIAVDGVGGLELASVPWAWWGALRRDPDQIRFLFDRVRPSPVDRESPGHFTITLQDRRWTGILEFLASGRVNRTGDMVDEALSAENRFELYNPKYALEGKAKGPLVAVAGAIVLVMRSTTVEREQWDPWLDNLSTWFQGLPDGPIVLGYRRLEQATNEEQLEQAYASLREGIRRGLPYFSASVGLLSAALARLANDLPAADIERRYITPIAARVDPEQPFTVIRLPRQE